MLSATNHARRAAAAECNDQQVADGFGDTTSCLKQMGEKQFDLTPNTASRIGLAWSGGESTAWLVGCIARNGKVVSTDVKASKCVTAGAALTAAKSGVGRQLTSTFRVQTKDYVCSRDRNNRDAWT
eukprot:369800-Rhodomonas_salina.1